MIAKAINTDKYYEHQEIEAHLKNVEYIIMATPAPSHFIDTPIHFTIFLNTSDELPKDIKDAVFEKFLKENSIKNPKEIMSQLMSVGFSMSQQDTAMPLLLVKPEDQRSIPYALMHVMDFLADSDGFIETKEHKLTGWSYKYNS
ncbi:hypothetical protein M947_04880 [Sulfurimonas hongkongensis]|uniref:Uncharacterized protein n=1 Tax=Sulfurimonas hongkongensis TaxID=1172190 RepID=T0KSD4_9BACT|nr:hypothetical protein [Sulfurimonas hongkongensis]EQB39919.1 hypothetical protein M947_04880 [Sulfurimonas hongkongensis]